MNKYVKLTLYGAIIWIVGLAVGVFLYTPEGTPRFDELFTQNIFYIVTTATAMILLWTHLKTVHTNFLREGIVIGIIWFITVTLMDIAILVPIYKSVGMTYTTWAITFFPMLFVLPIMSIGASLIAQSQRQQ